MERYINTLRQEYEDNLLGEIRQILQIFPEMRKISQSLSVKKHQKKTKRQYYQQLKRSSRKVNYSELADVCPMFCYASIPFIILALIHNEPYNPFQVDEQVRIIEHAYEYSVRQ